MTNQHDIEQDLRDLKQPHPAEHDIPHPDTDKVARDFGKKCLRWGIGLTGGTFITALSVVIVIGDEAMQGHPDGRLFSAIAFVAAIATGAGLIIVGGIDRLIRPLRAQARHQSVRIERIEQAIGAIAESLPHDLQAREWKGFNRAYTEGFVQQNGTDGAPTRGRSRTHLGLASGSTHPEQQ